MKIAVDLHSHSGYAGGVGQISLEDVSRTMKLKGIDVFGTGDCLFPPRTEELKKSLKEVTTGLFSLPNDNKKFLLQTEVIFSTRLKGYKNKTIAHHLIFFPDFASIDKLSLLMEKWQMKNTIGRPFIVSNNQKELEYQLYSIQAIDPLIEILPAHVMTPDGIMGSKNNLKSIIEFYGNFTGNIHCIETGLSADPEMLAMIPDFAELTMISNSDCHSAALNRIGREFTFINVTKIDYLSIIEALRKNNVIATVEFNPAEGRYYLTGHRNNRPHHTEPIIYSDEVPKDLICPVCNKKMLLGVKQRCNQLKDNTIKPKERKFIHLIPLIEVIANSLGIKTLNSQKVRAIFFEIMQIYDSEIQLWFSEDVKELLDKRVLPKTINSILAVQKRNFFFEPPGYDGIYGNLIIGGNE
ncbi:MAG: endonuclease Q family protein [Candidatus Cloacimonetes bacterium]|nr:endonuclease Q family protein [Candidatus Cloacimonadota bacterium]